MTPKSKGLHGLVCFDLRLASRLDAKTGRTPLEVLLLGATLCNVPYLLLPSDESGVMQAADHVWSSPPPGSVTAVNRLKLISFLERHPVDRCAVAGECSNADRALLGAISSDRSTTFDIVSMAANGDSAIATYGEVLDWQHVVASWCETAPSDIRAALTRASIQTRRNI